MAQVISLSALKASPGAMPGFTAHRSLEPIDPELRDLAPLGEPEAPVAIEFVGISKEQQRAALAAFPGGRRFRLLSDA